MSSFGVTDDGFIIKGLDTILNDSMDRARQMFGADVDLTSTSPLRKILEVTAMEDAELWKRMEDLYYSSFVSTATGDALDLLGNDIGVKRQMLFGEGDVQLKIDNPAPSRQYILPAGAILVTAAPVRAVFMLDSMTLDASTPQGTVRARAFDRGPDGNLPAGSLVDIDSAYRAANLNLGAAAVAVTNPQPFTGGETFETDVDYRQRQLGLPRNIWTQESVRRAALDVPGVTDVLLFDPLGGVDVSQSYFNLFNFGDRAFSAERQLGEPYFFDIVVAHEVGRPWRTLGAAPGVADQVSAAVDRVRPVGIHPRIIEADHIEIGIQATAIVEPGYDGQALLGAVKQRIAAEIGALRLGSAVLYSHVVAAFVEQAGIRDVQNLRLRRCPPAFGRITFGAVPFQLDNIEAAAGENIPLGATEIAIFRADNPANAIEAVSR